MLHRCLSYGIRPLLASTLPGFATLLSVCALLVPACESRCRPGQVKIGNSCFASSAAEDAGPTETVTDAGSEERTGESVATADAQGVSSSGQTRTMVSADSGVSAETTDSAGAAADQPSHVAGAGAMDPGANAASKCPAGTTPSAEECDGEDNDCDGMTDEGLTDAPCGSSTQGICRQGKKTCSGGSWSECIGAVEPAMEVCDAELQDEDCDGKRNEGCPCTPGEMRECGMERGACKKGMQTCSDDAEWGNDCADAVQPETEICDGRADEDCDGNDDDRDPDCECLNGLSQPCIAGLGVCVAGTRECQDGAWSECTSSVAPTPEECDGIDTDCDGLPDNNARCPNGQTCANGHCGCRNGASKDCTVQGSSGPCAAGKQTCQDGDWGECAASVTPQAESCDGIDNDCNGQVDDSNPCPNGRACIQQGATASCAACSQATVAVDCTEQKACQKPTCSSLTGDCEYVPIDELTPCARAGALEGFCRSGSCEPPKSASGNRMNPGEALMAGQKLVNGIYKLTCQADGKLVMSHTDGSSQIEDWSSGSSGAAAECVMQPDGNLVIYGSNMNVIWASNTAKPGTYVGNYLLLGQNSLKIMSPSGSVVRSLK